MFAAGVLVALLAVKSVMSTIRWQSSVASNKDAERRVRGFLVSKGLTDTQVAVLIALAEGMSDRQVADRLGYARGHCQHSAHDGLRRARRAFSLGARQYVVAGNTPVNTPLTLFHCT